MTALLEYPDPDCSIRVSRSFLANSVPKSGGAMAPLPMIYSMYKQENYVNKKLDSQKKKSVHKNAKEPCI